MGLKMRKKRFFQLNCWWLLLLLCLSIPNWMLFAWFIVDAINIGYFNAPIFGLTFVMMLPFSIIIFALEKHRIVLRKEDIFVPADWLGKRAKIQHKFIIKYDEIKDINIIRSTNNSLNKRITARMPNTFVLKLYMEFTCNNEEKKRIFIMYFSKKQIVRIINEIVSRAKQLGNDLQISTGKELLVELEKIKID